ncbi:hypothetical protein F5883DRAFT_160571 [Diaporthe sp. PMI_573]|nr:hypothetical protein F5883DRAFT_160571 [Diaporthaceae sp. PMI_573]
MSDESDSEEHYYSGSEEGDESQESESDGANHGLLDLEASEASSEPDYDADRLSDDGIYDGSYAEYNFPKFMQLPPEIREMVWGAFCPDLGSEPHVFELHLHTIISPPGAVHLPTLVRGIVAGPQLESQTEPMRTVLAVHRESRALGLKSAPHELSLSNGELVRYHEERDVLFVAWNEEILLRGIALRFQELGIEARNLAVPSIVTFYNQDELVDLMYLLPQAKRLFILDEEEDLQDPEGPSPMHFRDYAWTVTGKVHKYRLDSEEEGEIGLSIPVSRIFCWPDLDNFPEFAKENVTKSDDNWWWNKRITECRLRLSNPLEDSRELNQDDISDEEQAEAIDRLQNIEVWPMIRFNFGGGLDRFYYMESRGLGRDRLPPYDLSESGTSDEGIEDEYESSGIDDNPMDDSASDDDEDELLGQHLGQDTSHLHGSSSQLFDNTSEIDDLPPANFSSDGEVGEQDHITLTSNSDNDSGTQARASRRKRQVVDSDSDESATETEQTPPSRRRSLGARLLDFEDLDVDNDDESSDVEPVREANRRARAIPIDSEDEDEEGHDDDEEDDMPQPSRSGRRRGRAVPADSEDDDAEVVVQQPSGGRKRRGRVVQVDSDEEGEDDESDSQGGGAKTKDAGSSDEEESSSSDDGDDDPPPPPRRMSLAKRLSMESRQARSRHLHHDDDSGADEMTGDGYGYSDDQEDEVDGLDDGMVMGMAEEYEGEDGESEEEY